MCTFLQPFSAWRPLPGMATLLLLGLLASLPAGAVQIQATARPARVIYAADNKVTIEVVVLEDTSAPVPDATPVYFHTTLGTLPTVAYTKRGKVTVLLENQVGVGRAEITVTVGDTRRTLSVDFLGRNVTAEALAEDDRPFYAVRARHVYYGVDSRIFELLDDAVLRTPDVTIKAGAIQLDARYNIATAQRHVEITARGGKRFTAERVRLEFATRRGFAMCTEPELAYFTLTLPTLEAAPDPDEGADMHLDPLDPKPTRTWIISKDARVFPNDMIQFRGPKFYLDSFDKKLFNLPYHVLDLRGSDVGTFFNTQVSLTSDAGLNVDFPIYYLATPLQTGALHLRHVTQGSSFYRGQSGLQLSIEQDYLLSGNRGDGGLYLDDLLRPTRSASWEHVQTFGTTNVVMNAAYDRYSEETPYTKRLSVGLSRPVGKFDVSLNSNWSQFEGSQDGIAELSCYFPAFTLGKTGIALQINPTVGITRTTIDATTNTPRLVEQQVYQSLRSNILLPNRHLLGGTLSTNLTHELTNEQEGLTQYVDAGLTFRRHLNRDFAGSLGYSFTLTDSTMDGITSASSQRLHLDLVGNRARQWNFFSYLSYNLDSQMLYGSASATYYMPWDRGPHDTPRWYLRYAASMATSDSSSTSDHKFSLGRDFGPYGLVLHYSPTGNSGVTGIGSGTGKHWAIELVRQGW